MSICQMQAGMAVEIVDTERHWYALRDLKRANATSPAYKVLSEVGVEVFTPMTWRMVISKSGRKVGREVAIMPDLLFAYDTKENLDSIIARIPTLQYRYKRGGAYCEPIIVPVQDMNRFISAVSAAGSPRYYSMDEISSLNCGQRIRIMGGSMDGMEGKLLSIRGSRTKRLVVELPNLLAVSVEIQDEYIQIL